MNENCKRTERTELLELQNQTTEVAVYADKRDRQRKGWLAEMTGGEPLYRVEGLSKWVYLLYEARRGKCENVGQLVGGARGQDERK
jgi:hypothetical protein